MRCITLMAGLVFSSCLSAQTAEPSPVKISYAQPADLLSHVSLPSSFPEPQAGAPSAARLPALAYAPHATPPSAGAAPPASDTAITLPPEPAGISAETPASAFDASLASQAVAPALDSGAKSPDASKHHGDIWDRIRAGFAMPDLDNKLVARHQKWYLNQHDYMHRVVERSRPYMHYIVEELEKRGMPTELALLPIVESAFNPMAFSRARASGLWQFIPATGRRYKLDQTWWVDERRDVVASTAAALDYLTMIHKMHGDWQLALASYNWGEGAVKRAVAKNRARGRLADYSSLKMPKETKHYVPKLQALKNILNDPDLWATFNFETIPNKPHFASVPKPADMDVKLAAQLAEMPLEDFLALNAAHTRPVIKADIPLILPTDRIDIFNANLAKNEAPLISWQSYVFRKGDKLETIAARFGISLSYLKTINGITGKRARVVPGHSLLVPGGNSAGGTIEVASFRPPDPGVVVAKRRHRGRAGSPSATGKSRATSAKAGRASVAGTERYTVRKGDTLYDIARRFNVDARDISRPNGGSTVIKPGQQLLIARSG